ncbi:ABC-type amino acid transport substrate-binding protein [Rhizobium paranaense]|uniref:ABC-type amino acid transport substrate-binding protein n=1 Tax=Rhizobium paranaense TaxID=1650438 RepID=A0A7W8XU92_9HYPH|nr:ABC-type amino acid transport substrate-binding protein [Rhizobium paranaense]
MANLTFQRCDLRLILGDDAGLIGIPAIRACSFVLMMTALTSFSVARADDLTFDLSPEQPGRIHVGRDGTAVAAIPKNFKFVTPGTLTVAVAPGGPPLATYATDAKTVVGADPDIAYAIADSLGLKLELVPVAWID